MQHKSLDQTDNEINTSQADLVKMPAPAEQRNQNMKSATVAYAVGIPILSTAVVLSVLYANGDLTERSIPVKPSFYNGGVNTRPIVQGTVHP